MQQKPQQSTQLALFSSGWFILFAVISSATLLLTWELDIFAATYSAINHHLAPELSTTAVGELPYANLILLAAPFVALCGLILAIKCRLSVSFSLLMVFLILLASTYLLTLTQLQQRFPALEYGSMGLFAWLCGLLEKIHQQPLQHLYQKWQQAALLAAQLLLKQQQWREAFALLQQLPPTQTVLDLAYEVAQNCEQKRDFNRAKQIYVWVLEQRKNFRDCQQRLQQLDSIRPTNPGLGSTVAMDQTLLMPTEGLQPPTLGRYRIESVLGKGAMGVVYRGIDPAINREVAIKTLALSREFEDQEQQVARERFFREAETAGKLNHPNIVTVYDVGEEQDLAFIAMDLLTGVPLDQHIKREQLLPVVLVYQLMVQIASALAYAHKQGVVHRDIKPGNIIFDDEKQKVIITDFGIAHLMDKSKTRTGAILGSPFYMSPEQVQGKRIDGRSDIFSMGVTFYQLLTGQLPFRGESLATVALNITTQKHEPVRKLRGDLPASASRIINKALQKDKDKRYQNVDELKETLINALKRDFKSNPLE